MESNLIGFYDILEVAATLTIMVLLAWNIWFMLLVLLFMVPIRRCRIPIDDKVDNPVSLYSTTKKSNELLAHAYSKLYNIPSNSLRFFTVYGSAAGTGYVGLFIATLLAQYHKVYAVDIIEEKVDLINNRKSPIQD